MRVGAPSTETFRRLADADALGLCRTIVAAAVWNRLAIKDRAAGCRCLKTPLESRRHRCEDAAGKEVVAGAKRGATSLFVKRQNRFGAVSQLE